MSVIWTKPLVEVLPKYGNQRGTLAKGGLNDAGGFIGQKQRTSHSLSNGRDNAPGFSSATLDEEVFKHPPVFL